MTTEQSDEAWRGKGMNRPASRLVPKSKPDRVKTLAELRRTERGTITVEETAKVLGISRGKAFESVRNGDLVALRLGARWLVPVPKLLALLGADVATEEE